MKKQDGRFIELARVWRGPVVESLHRGVVVVADAAGKLRHPWGDPEFVTTPPAASGTASPTRCASGRPGWPS